MKVGARFEVDGREFIVVDEVVLIGHLDSLYPEYVTLGWEHAEETYLDQAAAVPSSFMLIVPVEQMQDRLDEVFKWAEQIAAIHEELDSPE